MTTLQNERIKQLWAAILNKDQSPATLTSIWTWSGEYLSESELIRIQNSEDPLLELNVVLLRIFQGEDASIPANIRELVEAYEKHKKELLAEAVSADKSLARDRIQMIQERMKRLGIDHQAATEIVDEFLYQQVIIPQIENRELYQTIANTLRQARLPPEAIYTTTRTIVQEKPPTIEKLTLQLEAQGIRADSLKSTLETVNRLAQTFDQLPIPQRVMLAEFTQAGMTLDQAQRLSAAVFTHVPALTYLTSFTPVLDGTPRAKVETDKNTVFKGYMQAFMESIDPKEGLGDPIQQFLKAQREMDFGRMRQAFEKFSPPTPPRANNPDPFFRSVTNYLSDTVSKRIVDPVVNIAWKRFAATEIGSKIVGSAATTAASTAATGAGTALFTGSISAFGTTLGVTITAEAASIIIGQTVIPIPFVGAAFGAVAGFVGSKAKDVGSWLARNTKKLSLALFVGGMATVGGIGAALANIAPAFGMAAGAVTGLGAAAALGIPQASGAIQSAGGFAAAGFGKLAALAFVEIATPIIVILLATPVVIALLLFIINNSAYIVPPSGGLFTARGGSGGGSDMPSCWPVDGQITQGPYYKVGTSCYQNGVQVTCSHTLYRNNALDIGATIGTPVYATHNGILTNRDELTGTSGYGNLAVVMGKNGLVTMYAHLLSFTAPSGSFVTTGTKIGLADDTGNSWGSHLHYELRGAGQIDSIVPGYKVLTRTTGCFAKDQFTNPSPTP